MIDIIRKHGSSIGWISLTAFVLFGMASCNDTSTNPQGTGDAYDGPEGVFLYDKDGHLFRLSQGNTSQITTVGGDEGKWSPNGSQIVFDSTRDGDGEIWVIDEDGVTTRQLTSNTADDEEPAWSPDGTLIIYQSNYNIYYRNSDGTGGKNWLIDGATDPDWKEWTP